MLTTRLFTNLSHTKSFVLPAISVSNNLKLLNNNEISKGSRAHKPVDQLACQYCSTSATTTPAGVANKTDAKDNGVLNRVLKKVGLVPNSKTRLRVSSCLLYENVADKVNYLEFFEEFKMPNTFNSWFLVTELHVWMLLVRSMAEGSESGQDGRFLRNCIVEIMWNDVNNRAKKLGAHNPSLTRQQIEELSEQFQAALIAYDEGIMSEDIVLAAVLWRRFLEMKCEDYEMIERLIKYVRRQVFMLDNLPRHLFLTKPKIPWENLSKMHI